MRKLGTKVRDARVNVREKQRILSQAIMGGSAERGSVEHKDLSAAAALSREELRTAQEELIKARKNLPPGSFDPSVEAEAGAEGINMSPELKRRPQGSEGERRPQGRTLGHSIGVEYQKCQGLAQFRNGERRESSLSNLALPADERGARFTKKARKAIPESVIEEIRMRNLLDTKLHERALEILAANRARWKQEGVLGTLPEFITPPPPVNQKPMKQKFRIPKPADTRPTEL